MLYGPHLVDHTPSAGHSRNQVIGQRRASAVATSWRDELEKRPCVACRKSTGKDASAFARAFALTGWRLLEEGDGNLRP